jgi:hypothetical protein
MIELKFSVFGLVKELKKSPEEIAAILCKTMFHDYETSYQKGIITLKKKA